jgi:hypothetical protein
MHGKALVAVAFLVCVAAVRAADETEISLVEAGASLADEFTVCLRDRPLMCLSPAQDFRQDGSSLLLSERLRTIGQKFRLEGGVLTFADDASRVVAAEHGAQKELDSPSGGRAWIWKKLELNYDQQFSIVEEAGGAASICMRAFPKACLHAAYPTENKVILASSDRVKTAWVVRPTKPCAANPCENGACSEQTDGTAKCTCNAGYSLGADNKCFEIDVCAHSDTNPCDANAVCAKTGPGKSSCACNKGFEGKGGKNECTAIDVCKKQNPCDGNSVCQFTGPLAFKCSCKAGYVPVSPTNCEELDLCATANPCHKNAACKKTGAGQVSCTCNPGFAGNGQSCEESDGCAGSPCGEHSTCERRPLGGRECKCDAGHEVDKNAKQFHCAAVDPCKKVGPPFCKGRNQECRFLAPGQARCLCKAGLIPFVNGNCEVPGSKEALAAAADEGSEGARQELNYQKHKAKAAEERRKEMEMEFRRKQKEREENIRALEARIRTLIRETTNARITDRDHRISALNDHIVGLQSQQAEASKTAGAQLALIKALEKSETEKVKRLTTAMEEATSKIKDAARKYAERLRERTRAELAASEGSSPAPEAPTAPAPAPKPAARKPVDPPQYHNAHSAQPLKLPIARSTPIGQAKRRVHSKPTGPAPAPRPKPSVRAPTPTPAKIRFQQIEAEVDTAASVEAAAAAAMKSDLSADLASLSTVSEAELAQSDEDLQSELAKLHAEVDSHLDAVLGSEDEAEEGEDAAEEEDAEEEAEF